MLSLLPVSAYPRFHVHLRICVEGEYRSSHAERPFHGNYRCVLNARAMLERDNGDYILYRLDKSEEDVDEVMWTEAAGVPGKERICSLDDLIHPELEMRFALRDQGQVVLDFLVTADVNTPGLDESKQKFFWPRSFTGTGTDVKKSYGNGIYRGSNRVEWRESAMVKPHGTQGECGWSWKDIRNHWTHTHRVHVSISATPEKGESR